MAITLITHKNVPPMQCFHMVFNSKVAHLAKKRDLLPLSVAYRWTRFTIKDYPSMDKCHGLVDARTIDGAGTAICKLDLCCFSQVAKKMTVPGES